MLSSVRIFQHGLNAPRLISKLYRRNFMSENFRCQTAWNKRLSSPILQKIKINDLFVQLDDRLDSVGSVSAVDVDLFANSVNSEDHLDELDSIVHRFRLGTGSHRTLPTTYHAVVRAYLDYGDHKDLVRILDDRLNYGIFLDDYLNVLVMDHLIKKQDFTSAAKIACMRMLQEDFDSSLANYMALFSCHKYLLSPKEWEAPPEPVADDGEEVKIRVHYIRNPFFDDHFDLKEPNALIGKTLHYICRTMDSPLGKSYRALGLVLHKKWDDAEQFISSTLKDNAQFYSPSIEMIDNFVGTLPEEEQANLGSLKETITAARESSLNRDLLAEVEEKIKELVLTEEKKMIDQQTQAYSEWETIRENLLKIELEEINKKKQLEEIQRKKEELMREEEEIFFFDNEDAIDLKIDNKRVRYPKKWLGKKRPKRVTSMDYVPPEIKVQKPWAS